MNAYWYSIQWGFKPRLNKVKASGGCRRFYRAPLDKIWAQICQGAFDFDLKNIGSVQASIQYRTVISFLKRNVKYNACILHYDK
ncbi:hypothetical protein J6TS1_36070 [Siminovitchia terrae]|uniref:Uncharacterized protein n=1 Tax=Siminovitchia terrae TaxID=1914933 RepID=A0ABQ4L196_SIMTE|nr:hypothetical protein [Siminovitchia terrae]GIN97737.1 hypothetical protein J6TS1_36070 [Siminovitchia terrae]